MLDHIFALEQLSVLELDPLSFVDVAASAGYQAIGLHLQSLPVPHAVLYNFFEDDGLADAMAAKLKDSGVRLHVVEPFLISKEMTRDVHLRNLDLGLRLGAAVAGTLAFDSDANRRADRLAQLSLDAQERGMALTIEPYLESTWRTLTDAVAAAEAADSSAGVTLDVLHVIRGGEHWDSVANMPRERIRTIQISDGPLEKPANWPLAAVTDRAIPGEGEFNLAALMPLLPHNVPIGIEVPSLKLAARMPALARVRLLLERTRALLAGADLKTAQRD